MTLSPNVFDYNRFKSNSTFQERFFASLAVVDAFFGKTFHFFYKKKEKNHKKPYLEHLRLVFGHV